MTPQSETIKRIYLVALCITFCAASAPVLAHSYKFGDIEVGHLWGPPPAAAKPTEINVFGPLMNDGATADRLLLVSSPVAEKVEFRNGKDEGAAAGAIDLSPSKPVSLAPWGVHLRLIGLKHQVKDKDWVPIRLVFEKAGAHDAKVLIETQPGH